jgi:hypothetical protein
MAWTTLAHAIDMPWLTEAYRRTRKGGAAGVDGLTGKEYGESLETNLQGLVERMHQGKYLAPPVRRVHIPKSGGTGRRPIGLPTFEDKVLQRAVTMLLEPIYEQDFLDCSYGFRPGRSAHDALRSFRQQAKLRGYTGYYGIPGNSRALRKFLHRVRCSWRFWLNRRSHKAKMTWQKMMLLLARYPLPRSRIGCSV